MFTREWMWNSAVWGHLCVFFRARSFCRVRARKGRSALLWCALLWSTSRYGLVARKKNASESVVSPNISPDKKSENEQRAPGRAIPIPMLFPAGVV